MGHKRTLGSALAMFAAAAVLGACGQGSEPAPAGQSATQAPAEQAEASGITEGRLGPAVTADASQPGEQVLDEGGPFDTSADDESDERTGVGDASGCANATTVATAQNAAVIKAATLCLMNYERRRRGLRRLRLNSLLDLASIRHSRDMESRNYFAHDSLSGASFTDRVRRTGYFRGVSRWRAGENIAWGSGSFSTPKSIVRAWMNSPPHRRNLLSSVYVEVGVGVDPGVPVSGRTGGATITTDFGKTTS